MHSQNKATAEEIVKELKSLKTGESYFEINLMTMKQALNLLSNNSFSSPQANPVDDLSSEDELAVYEAIEDALNTELETQRHSTSSQRKQRLRECYALNDRLTDEYDRLHGNKVDNGIPILQSDYKPAQFNNNAESMSNYDLSYSLQQAALDKQDQQYQKKREAENKKRLAPPENWTEIFNKLLRLDKSPSKDAIFSILIRIYNAAEASHCLDRMSPAFIKKLSEVLTSLSQANPNQLNDIMAAENIKIFKIKLIDTAKTNAAGYGLWDTSNQLLFGKRSLLENGLALITHEPELNSSLQQKQGISQSTKAEERRDSVDSLDDRNTTPPASPASTTSASSQETSSERDSPHYPNSSDDDADSTPRHSI